MTQTLVEKLERTKPVNKERIASVPQREKERVQSKVTPRKVGVGLKWRWELSKRRLGWRLA